MSDTDTPARDFGPTGDQVDLTNCDREPIHLLGGIQPHGALLALSSDGFIERASTTTADWFGRAPDELIGIDSRSLFNSATSRRLREALDRMHHPADLQREFAVELGDDRMADLAVHISDGSIIVELEPADSLPENDDLLRNATTRLREATTVQEVLDRTARIVRELTGFDRVMVYRFLPDDAGEVAAEAKIDRLAPFLGLRYPATDIPKQARALYKRNLIRAIADVGARPAAIVPELNGAGAPLDLSFSVLRSVSPIHIEYLTNMGVGASMSVSILQEDRLWGLVACHHYSPRLQSLRTRTQCELFAQIISLVLESRERAAQAEDERRVHALYGKMLDAASREDESVASGMTQLFPDLRALFHADGIGVWINGEYELGGTTPSGEEFAALVQHLNRVQTGAILASDNLAAFFPRAADYAERAAGALAIPLSREARDYLVLFRREVVQQVKWAGDPEKPAQLGPNGVRLTPRKSFEAWQETVRGRSSEWTRNDLNLADALRTMLLEVILKLTSEAHEARERAQEKQELLIGELNHRVRNMLGLVRSIVRQSRSGNDNMKDYVSVLDDRIQALARAHDQITEHRWAPSSVRKLIEAEGAAYLNDKPGRLVVEGPDFLVDPEAFSTLALVIHEMMTNSCKHGALCDNSGMVRVVLSEDAGGRMVVDWSERDGPPVKPPSRRGFGTTVIERSIPHELRGEATVRYEPAGVRARFVIPAAYVHISESETAPSAPTAARASELSGHVLILEDNLLVAMDAEHIALAHGADTVDLAAGVQAALNAIDTRKPDFALLDINLGGETSLPVARKLQELGVPFGFVSGYGERATLPPEFDGVPRLTKPISAGAFGTFVGKLKPA